MLPKKFVESQKKSTSTRPPLSKTARSAVFSDENSLSSRILNSTQSKLGNSKLPAIRTLPSLDDKSDKSPLHDIANSGYPSPCPEEARETEQDEESRKKDRVDRVKLPVYPNITDMKEFRKKHKLDPKTKVYIVTGGYGDIKKALDQRGWVQNPEAKSPCFDLKWTIQSKEEEMKYLEEFQLVNHFEKNASITTKVGLCRNLRNLVWFNNVNIDTFYPKCFDLSDDKDYEDFIEEFKYNKAESLLKLYVRLCSEKEYTVAKEMEETIQIAIQVCEKKVQDLDDMLEHYGEIQPVKITDEEWRILSKDEISSENLAKKKYEARLAKYENNGKAKKKTKKKSSKRRIIDVKNMQSDKEGAKKLKPTSLALIDQNVEEQQVSSEETIQDGEMNKELLEKIQAILKKLKDKNPQYDLIGDKNIWMLKPAGLSRGRGITCLKNLIEILDVARKNSNQWVVQKYIENPLIVHKRKFDIRQWVLVTDWNPLTVWFYEECYVRFSGDEYNTDDLENKFIHLTNNSVTKHLKANEDPVFEQNMWQMETFRNHLKERYGSDVFEQVIKPKMKQCVIWALESAQDMISNRKNCFELYGYDFMVDEDLNVWLIEINLSPSLDYSTPVTKRLVKMVSEDTIKVIVDHGTAKKNKRADIPTGLFSCIHKSKKSVEKPTNSYGLDLICEGVAIEKPEKELQVNF